MNREELQTKSLEELKDIAQKLKVKVHHKAKEESIINQILQQPVAYQTDAMQHVSQQQAPEPLVIHTEEQVRNAIKKQLQNEDFQAIFKPDNTWTFKYNGREDSGHMSTSLRVIQIKAESVARGRLAPKGFKDGKDFVLWG